MIQRVALLGTGLIGGSLGLAWRSARPALTLVGFDRPDVAAQAVARGAVQTAAGSVREAVAGADVVVLAAPVRVLPALLAEAAPHLKPGAVVTDVGSVKAPLAAEAARLLAPENPFVGGHPMAGREVGGIASADAFLFENATYVLCPPPGVAPGDFPDRFGDLIDLVAATGGRVLLLDAERHDRIAAAVSHVPQLLAVTLMNATAHANATDDAFLKLAAGGFRDMTRIASSPFGLWRDIVGTNAAPIADRLATLIHELQQVHDALRTHDEATLAARFADARRIRETIPKNSKGFLHPLVDVYVYAEDRPGFLLHIVQSVYQAGLNLKDIELLKIREGTGGAFRLGFNDDLEATRAIAALTASGLTAYRL